MPSRRSFLTSGSLAAGVLATGIGRLTPRRAFGATPVDTAPRAGDPMLRDLTQRALDAATHAGATYADVRLSSTRRQSFNHLSVPVDREDLAAGVRVLVDGVWGFASSPLWTLDEMARLGTDAVSFAIANRQRGVPRVELGDRPPPAVGTWHAPVQRDPFTVPEDEKLDYITALRAYASQFPNIGADGSFAFGREERTFASTDGTFCTQTCYRSLDQSRIGYSDGGYSYLALGYHDSSNPELYGRRDVPIISPNGGGWETLSDSGLIDLLPQWADEARQVAFSREAVVPGRYQVVFDGYAMAAILSATIGSALEIDRALGLEANASGTSYLTPPTTMIGHQLGPSWLDITANRSAPGAAATVQWDDDGVVPRDISLIQHGQLFGYETSRAFAGVLSAWYGRHGMPVVSAGYAGSASAATVPLVQPANLRLTPDPRGTSFDDLVAHIDDGYVIKGGYCMMDQQQLTGQLMGELLYRVKKGKNLGAVKFGGGCLFRAPELWKNLLAVGGASTSCRRGLVVEKGEPSQELAHSVDAVAALVSNIVVINVFATIRAQAPNLNGALIR